MHNIKNNFYICRMLPNGTNIWKTAVISKDVFDLIAGGLDKKFKPDNYMDAIAFIIYCKKKFTSSYLYGKSQREIADKLGISRGRLIRYINLCRQFNLIDVYSKNETSFLKKDEKISYRLRKIKRPGINYKVEINVNDNINMIKKRLYEAYLTSFVQKGEIVRDKVIKAVCTSVKRHRRNITSIKGMKNASEDLIKLCNDLCSKAIDLNLYGRDLDDFLKNRTEFLVMHSIESIQNYLGISKNRLYQTRKLSEHIRSKRNWAYLKEKNDNKCAELVTEDRYISEWSNELTELGRKGELSIDGYCNKTPCFTKKVRQLNQYKVNGEVAGMQDCAVMIVMANSYVLTCGIYDTSKIIRSKNWMKRHRNSNRYRCK